MPKNYKPEERLQVATCQMLHALAPASILYFHPAQEAIRSKATWGFQVEMGFVKGVSDWIIMGLVGDRRTMLAIELKADKRKASDSQTDFGKWCDRAGIGWFVVWTVREFGGLMISHEIFNRAVFDEWEKYKLPLLAAQLDMPEGQMR